MLLITVASNIIKNDSKKVSMILLSSCRHCWMPSTDWVIWWMASDFCWATLAGTTSMEQTRKTWVIALS